MVIFSCLLTRFKSIIALISVLVVSINVFCNNTFTVPSNQYTIDYKKGIVVSNVNLNGINSTYNDIRTHIKLDVIYTFLDNVHTLKIGKKYRIINQTNNSLLDLYFTELPIIRITTENIIVDEPRVFAQFSIVEMNQNEIKSNIGIEYRGAYSQNFEKKPYRIEFWEDNKGEITKDVSLLGMRSDDDWNLNAIFNEPSRINSKLSNDLWLKLAKPLYYNEFEPRAVNGIQMKYTELFINSEYMGVYLLSERIDRKQLRLKEYKNSIKGELYKGYKWDGAETFTSLPSIPTENNIEQFWSGFEYIYPETSFDWSNLYDFVDFVINTQNNIFYGNYNSKFDITNSIDYFIFLNLLRATDNTGKNIHIAKYDEFHPYFYVPWDLDGTFGIKWDGSRDNVTNDLLYNGFYSRLWHDCSSDGFRNKLQIRWNELRNTLLNHSQLMGMFDENFNLLLKNGVYKREEIAYKSFKFNYEIRDYTSNWILERLEYLDYIFNTACFNLSEKTLIYPNPASQFVYIDIEESNNLIISIFTTTGQLVQPISYGLLIENKISIEKLNNGFYLVVIQNDKRIKTFKLLVNK